MRTQPAVLDHPASCGRSGINRPQFCFASYLPLKLATNAKQLCKVQLLACWLAGLLTCWLAGLLAGLHEPWQQQANWTSNAISVHDLSAEQWHHALHQCVCSVDIDGESTHLVKGAVSLGMSPVFERPGVLMAATSPSPSAGKGDPALWEPACSLLQYSLLHSPRSIVQVYCKFARLCLYVVCNTLYKCGNRGLTMRADTASVLDTRMGCVGRVH